MDRRLWLNIDWLIIVGVLSGSCIGLFVIYSATHLGPEPDLWIAQLTRIVLGLCLLFAVLMIDYHSLVERAELFYISIVVMLLYLVLFGGLRAGTNRWLEFGFLTLQPGELAKIAVVLLLGKYFAAVSKDTLKMSEMITAGALAGIPIVLVALQPDLGTALTVGIAYCSMVVLAGLKRRMMLLGFVFLVLTVPITWSFMLKDYQKERVYAFLDPSSDPRGIGYQSIQSTIAVGSGGFAGKGWLEGTQSQLQFLPTPHTDFVFAVLAEEFGFIGVVVVLLLYAMITLRCLDTARRARDRIGIYIVVGVLSMFVFQTLYNLAMVAGLVPIKGFPLPLLSYGGSSMLATMVGFGLIMNVRMRRFVN